MKNRSDGLSRRAFVQGSASALGLTILGQTAQAVPDSAALACEIEASCDARWIHVSLSLRNQGAAAISVLSIAEDRGDRIRPSLELRSRGGDVLASALAPEPSVGDKVLLPRHVVRLPLYTLLPPRRPTSIGHFAFVWPGSASSFSGATVEASVVVEVITRRGEPRRVRSNRIELEVPHGLH